MTTFEMETKKYKYISFIEIEQKPKTKVWRCVNNKSQHELGIVKWYSSWRQYCYFPTVQAAYSKGCLDDINDFITTISAQRLS